VGVTLTPGFSGFSTLDDLEPTLIAKTDANVLQHLDPVTLEPRAITSYASVIPELSGPLCAAHAAVLDGELHNFSLGLGRFPSERLLSTFRCLCS
jgi:hypothetical protein